MKKLIAIIVCACLCVFMSSSIIYASEANDKSSPIDSNTLMFCEKANNFHQRLIDHWGGTYPDYYAGAYIEGQKLYILVTCEPKEAREQINQVNGAEICSIVRVKYPYNKLMAVYEEMNNRFQNAVSDEIIKMFTDWYVNEIDNCITVSIYSDSNVDKQIKDYLGYEEGIIEIEYVEGPNKPCSLVIAGNYEYVSHGATASTISFCATRLNSAGVWENGFVIAGHSGELNQEIIIDGTTVGVVSARLYGGNCDASFVNMNNVSSNYTRSTQLSTGYNITSHCTVGLAGTTYESHGMYTGIQTGFVQSRSCTVTCRDPDEGDIRLTDMIKMRISVNEGDSGSPLVASSTGTQRSIVGTLSGKSDNGSYGYYTKYSNIASQFNLELYTNDNE